MKCIRFEANGNKRIGFIDGDVVRTVYGSLETFWRITDEVFRLEDVKLLAPCVPKQIICVGFNYRSHAEEFHVQWLRSKSFDTFCPLGPWLETDLDPTDLSIKTYLNGELKQNGRTSDMVYNPYEILSYISESMTLDAGDLVLTGTPMGCGPMVPGDVVTVEIEGIGKLTNTVVKG